MNLKNLNDDVLIIINNYINIFCHTCQKKINFFFITLKNKINFIIAQMNVINFFK